MVGHFRWLEGRKNKDRFPPTSTPMPELRSAFWGENPKADVPRSLTSCASSLRTSTSSTQRKTRRRSIMWLSCMLWKMWCQNLDFNIDVPPGMQLRSYVGADGTSKIHVPSKRPALSLSVLRPTPYFNVQDTVTLVWQLFRFYCRAHRILLYTLKPREELLTFANPNSRFNDIRHLLRERRTSIHVCPEIISLRQC